MLLYVTENLLFLTLCYQLLSLPAALELGWDLGAAPHPWGIALVAQFSLDCRN